MSPPTGTLSGRRATLAWLRVESHRILKDVDRLVAALAAYRANAHLDADPDIRREDQVKRLEDR